MNNLRHNNSCFTVLATFTLLVSFISITFAQVIHVSSNQNISGGIVTLNDLASNPGMLPETWAAREIMPSPPPGKSVKLQISSIAASLQKYPDMKDVTLRGKIFVEVKRTGKPVAPEAIKEAVKSYIHNTDPWAGESVSIDCRPVKEAYKLRGESAEIIVTGHQNSDQSNMYVFDLAITNSGTEKNRFKVKARVVKKETIWVAKKTMQRGHRVKRSDIEKQLVPGGISDKYVLSSKSITGMEINRSVRANQPISSHYLRQPICAKRGDLINVTAKTDSLRVVLNAKALATGRKDEKIMCLNQNSNQTLLVRLIDTKTATVDF